MPDRNRPAVKNGARRAVRETTSASREPAHDLVDYLRDYARERPEVVALWCFGIGFIIGWKLKPW